MKYMLDTNICIYLVKNKPLSVLENFKEHKNKGIVISSITLAELLYGVNKSSFPERNQLSLNQFLAFIEVIDFGDSGAKHYGKLRAYLEKKGQTIGPLDMLIASHALAANLTLVTNNLKEFQKVPDLKIDNWV
jgi:tRNA(fMet)-specific endonuclease VapC